MTDEVCPYCDEEILATAKKCKHCGEWLDENSREALAYNIAECVDGCLSIILKTSVIVLLVIGGIIMFCLVYLAS